MKGVSRLRVDISGGNTDKSHLVSILNEDELLQLRESENEKNEPNYEVYVFDPPLPKGYAKGLLFGTQRYELGGKTAFICKKSGLQCKLEFCQSRLFSVSRKNRVHGTITSVDAKTTHFTFSGEWDKIVKIEAVSEVGTEVLQSMFPNGIIHDFQAVPTPTPFQDYSTEEALSTSSNEVWKEVSSKIIEGNYSEAEKEKVKVEVAQRAYISKLSPDRKHVHKYFEEDEDFSFLVRKDLSAFNKPLLPV